MNANGSIVIGLSGMAGAGKDTAAEFLSEWFGATHDLPVEKVSFAEPIKRAVVAMLGYPCDEAHMELLERAKRDGVKPVPGVDKTMREFLQTLGTEWGRDVIDKDLWVKLACARIERYCTHNHRYVILITDVRFPNEASTLRNRFGAKIVYVDRPEAGAGGHASERGVLDVAASADYKLNNTGSLEDFKCEVQRLAKAITKEVPHG